MVKKIPCNLRPFLEIHNNLEKCRISLRLVFIMSEMGTRTKSLWRPFLVHNLVHNPRLTSLLGV